MQPAGDMDPEHIPFPSHNSGKVRHWPSCALLVVKQNVARRRDLGSTLSSPPGHNAHDRQGNQIMQASIGGPACDVCYYKISTHSQVFYNKLPIFLFG